MVRRVAGPDVGRHSTLMRAMTALFLLLAAAGPSSAEISQQQGFDYQGVPLGMTLEDFQRVRPEATCATYESDAAIDCTTSIDDPAQPIFSAKFRFAVVGSQAPRLSEITLFGPPRRWNEALSGLTGRWGRPTSRELRFPVWTRGSQRLVFHDLAQGFVVTYTDVPAERRRASAAGQARARNF